HHSPVAGSRRFSILVVLVVTAGLFAAPLRAQQPASQNTSSTAADPTFDTLLSADSYKLYAEVRNVGQLLTTGGAGEIVEPIIKLASLPIIKLASPGPEFNSLLNFL